MYRLIGLALGCLLLRASPALAQEAEPLSNGAVIQLGGPRLQVTGDIIDSAFTPNKRGFVVVNKAANTGTSNVVLFDVASGLQRQHFEIYEAAKVVVARDRPMMAVVTMHDFQVWDLAKNKRVRQWPRPDPWYKGSIAIAPDGSQVVVSSRYMDPTPILRFDVATGDELPPLQTRPECTVSFSADGKKIFAVSATFRKNDAPPIWGKVSTWDAATGKKLAEMEHRHDYAMAAPDGRTAAFGVVGKQIRIVDLHSHETRATLDTSYVDFVFTPDSKQLLIAEPNSPHRLWDIAGKKEVRVFEGPSLYGLMPRISPDGRLVAAFGRSGYDRVQFWEMASGKQGPFPQGHPSIVTGVAFAPDGRQLASCSKDTLLIFDLKCGAELRRWVSHQGSIEQIAYSPDGKLLASSSTDGAIRLWDPATGEEHTRLSVKGAVKSFAFSPNGTSLTAVGDNRTIQQWDIKKGIIICSTAVPSGMPVPSLSPTGEFACFFGDGLPRGDNRKIDVLLSMMNLDTGKMLLPIATPRDDGDGDGPRSLIGAVTWGAACSVDGKLVATSDGMSDKNLNNVRIWEVASRREVLRFDNPLRTRMLAVSPDCRILAHGVQSGGDSSSADQALILSDIFAGQKSVQARGAARKLAGHLGAITSLTFSADSRFLATGGSDGGIFIWPVKDFLKLESVVDTQDAASYWPILADAEPAQAYRAIAQLERRFKEAIALLRQNQQAAPRTDDKALAVHVRNLESSSYTVRQKAFASLGRAGDKASHFMKEALTQKPTLEAKRRLEMLLEKLGDPAIDSNQLRAVRCVTLLERIGTAEARLLLEEWSRGAPEAWLTVEVRHSLRRLAGKVAP